MSEQPMNPMMGFVLAQSNLTRDIEETDQLKPTKDQYALKVGDKCLVAGTSSELDQDFETCEIIDPAAHAEEYPDWADRIQRSYLLCRYSTIMDPLGDTGWFARVKLIQIPDDKFEEIRSWDLNDLPDEPPAWLTEIYDKYAKELAALSPGTIPVQVPCENCGGKDVGLLLMHHTHTAAHAGTVKHEGKTVYVQLDEENVNCHLSAKLYCPDCESERELNPDEVRIVPGTAMSSAMHHH